MMKRNSTFELLRIISMFFIVLYHLILSHIDSYPDAVLMKSLMPTLHVGVPVFVLISGYFGIKPSIRGIMRLLSVVIVFYLPLQLLRCIHANGSLLQTCMFITNTPYWFFRTYMFLYLLSPIVNAYLDVCSKSSRILVIISLSIISCYFGFTEGDLSIIDGKNVVNFIFWYIIGNTLFVNKGLWQNKKTISVLSCYIILNILIISILYLSYRYNINTSTIYNLVFPYDSIILLINAVLLFVLIGRCNICSDRINYIATSVFSIYIIHHHPGVVKHIISPLQNQIIEKTTVDIFVLFYYIIFTLFIMLASIGIDKLFTPIWNLTSKISILIDGKLKKILNRIN